MWTESGLVFGDTKMAEWQILSLGIFVALAIFVAVI